LPNVIDEPRPSDYYELSFCNLIVQEPQSDGRRTDQAVGSGALLGVFFIRPIALIRNELHQLAIRIAEINTDTLSLHARSDNRTDFDRHLERGEVRYGDFDQARPFEAEVAAASWNWNPRVRLARLARTMHIQLFAPKAIRPTIWESNQLCSQDVAIKAIGALPVGDGDDTVVELWLHFA
jgi:hypothetical protein